MKKYSNRIIGVLLVIILSISIFAFNVDVNAKALKYKIIAEYGIKLRKTAKKDVYKIDVDYNIRQDDADKMTQFVITKVTGKASKNYVGIKFKKHSSELNIKPLNGVIEIDFKVDIVGPKDTQGRKYKVDNTTGTIGKRSYGEKYDIKSSVISSKKLDKLITNVSKSNAHPNYDDEVAKVPASNKISKNGSLNKTLTCNVNSSKNYYINGVKKGQYNKDTDYYANKNYYKTSRRGKTIKYTYRYSNGRKKKTVNVCRQDCTEVVKVEYGPPVASKAGLCFQYKFKVTSYVQCTTHVYPNYPKDDDYKTCTPPPECYNAHLGVLKQGGPNEKYEQCIRECDGGKYSRSCSDKCYKEVYGSKKSVKTTNNVDVAARVVQLKDSSKKCPDSDGCYYWSGNKILWKAGTSDLGRWYREYKNRTGKTYDPKAFFPGTYHKENGIWVEDNCSDSCSWDTDKCSKNDYLNPKQAEADAVKHAEGYIKKLEKCKASAICTEKTSTYTIKVDYKTKKEQGTKNFPNSGKDKLVSPDGSGNTNNNPNTTIISPGQTVTEDTNSCYTPDSKYTWYQGEWTFPGSYINAKTGELRYDKPSSLNGWIAKDKHYCLPLNSVEVNRPWWIWDQISQKYYGNSNGEYIDNIEKYNIEGKTESFGHYGWKFIMKCFYAVVNSEIVSPTDDNGISKDPAGTPPLYPQESKSSTGLNNHEFRVVDTNKLFASRTGDKIGFNWTDASVTQSKFRVSDMVESMKNKSIYSGTPDYSFHLTKENLAAIRNISSMGTVSGKLLRQKKNDYNILQVNSFLERHFL